MPVQNGVVNSFRNFREYFMGTSPQQFFHTTITGGAAGNHTVTGIKASDVLGMVTQQHEPVGQLVSGTTAATNIAVAGVGTGDRILSVLHFTSGALTADLTSEASISIAGQIQLSTTNTSSDQLWVTWERAGADLTSEFSLTAANTINNTGGTATTGRRITVWYIRG